MKNNSHNLLRTGRLVFKHNFGKPFSFLLSNKICRIIQVKFHTFRNLGNISPFENMDIWRDCIGVVANQLHSWNWLENNTQSTKMTGLRIVKNLTIPILLVLFVQAVISVSKDEKIEKEIEALQKEVIKIRMFFLRKLFFQCPTTL